MKSFTWLRRVVWCVVLACGFSGAAMADVAMQPLGRVGQRGPNLVGNPGFEEIAGDRPAGWHAQASPQIVLDKQCVHGGQASLRLEKSTPSAALLVSRNVELNQKQPAPLVVSGWSKAEKVEGKQPGYAVWVDLQYTDGSKLYGQQAAFAPGTHDWQYAELAFRVAKPVKRATICVLFRGDCAGTVWFDDVALQEITCNRTGIFDGAAVAQPTETVCPPPVAQVAAGDGLVLGFAQRGELVSVQAGGKSLVGTAPGGFWVHDVAADGPWFRVQGRAVQDGRAVRIEGTEPEAGLRFEARLEPGDKTIHITGTVQDTRGEDRAVTVCFVLPLAQQPRTWHDDIVRSRAAEPDREYMNAQTWPAGALLSAYPFASITGDETGLAMAAPMDCPRVCRFVYNTSLGVFYAAYNFGLAREPVRYPGRADFRLALYQHAPQWGFRAAAQGYYDRFPQFFRQRLKRGGIWMAFADISKVERFEDFGFAYDELGGNHQAFDDTHGIASFHYVEPMTYWLAMAKKYPRTYEGAMQALADNEASGKPDPVKWAQVTRRSGVFNSSGLLDVAFGNYSWCDGAVFTLNPDPGIAEDAACPKNKGHVFYNRQWADKQLPPKPEGQIHGVYLDSMPNWGDIRNWRREHWQTIEAPLTFDAKTKKPVLLQIFSTWQFSKYVADDVHARGGVMHGNGGAMWPYFPALLDITGQETHGILTDTAMARARTLLGNKPYSPLMNGRFDEKGAEMVEDYFHVSALYGIFPSFFDGSYLKDDKWVSVNYFKSPMFYNRDRRHFQKFIPILKKMFDATWQVVTHARVQPSPLQVERYGTAAGGELFFAVYNPAKTESAAQLEVDAVALGLKPDQPAAAGLVSGRSLECRWNEGKLTIAVPLGPKKCEVVRLGK